MRRAPRCRRATSPGPLRYPESGSLKSMKPVKPRQALERSVSHQPQRGTASRQFECAVYLAVLLVPRERRTEVVDLDFCPQPAEVRSPRQWPHRTARRSTCSSRDGDREQRRPLPTRRASPARTAEWFPASGIAFGRLHFRRRRATCRRAASAGQESGAAATRPHRKRACAASRSNPPMNADNRRNRIRSGSVSNACDQSTDASRLC